MKTVSAKAKGRLLQQQVVRLLRKHYNFDTDVKGCYEGDIQSVPMGMSRQDVRFSPAADAIIPFSIECKNQQHLNIWNALQQSESHTNKKIPLLIFKRNKTPIYACLKLEDLLELMNNDKTV